MNPLLCGVFVSGVIATSSPIPTTCTVVDPHMDTHTHGDTLDARCVSSVRRQQHLDGCFFLWLRCCNVFTVSPQAQVLSENKKKSRRRKITSCLFIWIIFVSVRDHDKDRCMLGCFTGRGRPTGRSASLLPCYRRQRVYLIEFNIRGVFLYHSGQPSVVPQCF